MKTKSICRTCTNLVRISLYTDTSNGNIEPINVPQNVFREILHCSLGCYSSTGINPPVISCSKYIKDEAK